MSGEPSAKRLKRSSCEQERVLGYDPATQRILEEMDVVQNEVEQLNEKASLEILAVEQKYKVLKKPFYARRTALCANIRNFWFTAIMNHADLSALLDESEEECLHYLTKLEVEENDDIKSGYTLRFYFDENPYFENSVLTKTYSLSDETASSESTHIIWKEGFCLGQSNNSIGINHLTNRMGLRRRFDSSKTFFSWFSDNEDAATDDIAEIIKDDLWPNPLQYYLVPDSMEADDNGTGDADDSDSSFADDENDVDRKSNDNGVSGNEAM